MAFTIIPQLRVRTEFHFKNAFGPIERVADALRDIECPAAGIVDVGTWGHVRWMKALKARNIKSLFGVEVPMPDGNGLKPVSWVLAERLPEFYRLSTALRVPDADPFQLLKAASGVVRFAGASFSDPELVDYIDISPSSPILMALGRSKAKEWGKPLVLTSDAWYPTVDAYNAFMAMGGRERVTPQHLLTVEEMRKHFAFLSPKEFERAVENTFEVAERCSGKLPVAPLIHFDGDLAALAESGKVERVRLGHIAEWTEEYESRLRRELAMIASKQYESYFLVVADLIRWAKTKMLVGPARGSSAGSLVCYLLRITEVDPIQHELLFERFIDVSRNDLPDIDIDFSDTKRDMIFGYLADKYGNANVARIGSINTLRAKTVIAKVTERFGIPAKEKFDVLNVLIDYSSGDSRFGHSLEDTMSQTESGKRFAERYPEAAVMFELENHASHTGIHAAGVIVCNERVDDFCTVGPDGVAQLDKPDAESLGLLKIDALGLRTLGVIEDAGVVTADELYALKLDDPKVFAVFNQNKYSGIFQFEGQAQRRVAAHIQINSFKQIDHITALARPGPLGGGASNKYINRARGREEVEYRHPSMAEYLSKTMGVVLYQEQVMRICFEIGQFSWEVVSEIRKAMSGRKGKEYFDRRGAQFVAGAVSIGVPAEDAKTIWAEICTFGAWGMNASHTVSYGVISYWCAWMKCYHPLQYAAACLRNAKDDDQAIGILRELNEEGVKYVPFDIDRSDVDWAAVDGQLIGGFKNLIGYGPAKSVGAVQLREQGKLNREKVLSHQVKFADLYPLQTQYAYAYADPESIGCRQGSVILTGDQLVDGEEVLYLCQIIQKELRDENETVRAARRDGKLLTGQTLFADIMVKDDAGIPCTIRIDRFKYERLGKRALEQLRDDDVILVRGKKIPNFNMIKAEKIKCLSRPEAL